MPAPRRGRRTPPARTCRASPCSAIAFMNARRFGRVDELRHALAAWIHDLGIPVLADELAHLAAEGLLSSEHSKFTANASYGTSGHDI